MLEPSEVVSTDKRNKEGVPQEKLPERKRQYESEEKAELSTRSRVNGSSSNAPDDDGFADLLGDDVRRSGGNRHSRK